MRLAPGFVTTCSSFFIFYAVRHRLLVRNRNVTSVVIVVKTDPLESLSKPTFWISRQRFPTPTNRRVDPNLKPSFGDILSLSNLELPPMYSMLLDT